MLNNLSQLCCKKKKKLMLIEISFANLPLFAGLKNINATIEQI